MATKAQLESKLAELERFKVAASEECGRLEEQNQKLKDQNKTLELKCDILTGEYKQAEDQRDEARHKNVMLITEHGSTTAELDRQKRRVHELEGLLTHIASLCEHRSRVSHSVMLFECDADGNRLIVPEEVRFLREIHTICHDCEIPF